MLNKELYRKVKIQKLRADTFLISFISIPILLVLGYMLFDNNYFVEGSIVCVLVLLNIILICCTVLKAKKERETTVSKPCIVYAKHIGYDTLIKRLETLSSHGNKLCDSENLYFFKFKKKLWLTTILYRTHDFYKNDFDNSKKRINKKANKQFNLSHYIVPGNRPKTIRINIIYADCMNEELYKLMSTNANHNLRRAEGLINIAFVAGEVIIPPIYGDYEVESISRYKKILNFIVNDLVVD